MNGDERLEEVLRLPPPERLSPLVELGRGALGAGLDGRAVPKLVHQLTALLDEGVGAPKERLDLGEVLGLLGDPRLRTPDQADYWVTVPAEEASVVTGRFPVTNHEFRRWVDGGGYRDTAAWSDAGRIWLTTCADPWHVRAEAPGSAPFVVPNQPVVGVTYWEADAYARAHGVRLPYADERLYVVRGPKKRPYPWGEPFGEGNANTREEVLGRPVAVGLFLRDRTPDGVCDLAGNVAEWLADPIGADRMIHPGAYDQPSMAAWAKAKDILDPSSRTPGIGFRLAKDA